MEIKFILQFYNMSNYKHQDKIDIIKDRVDTALDIFGSYTVIDKGINEVMSTGFIGTISRDIIKNFTSTQEIITFLEQIYEQVSVCGDQIVIHILGFLDGNLDKKYDGIWSSEIAKYY